MLFNVLAFCYNRGMRIERIKLMQFRNYESLDLSPHPQLTVLLGDNAQGKTNILEAIGLCATGRSHRTPHDAQLIHWDRDGSYIGLNIKRLDVSRRIEVRLRRNKGKQIRLDGNPIARMGELMGCLNAVFFSPEDLRLVKGGPGERRRFLDMEISQIYPRYFFALSGFSRALAQRNALLKNIASGRSPAELLDSWDEQLAEYGCLLISLRRLFVSQLHEEAARIHREISGRRETLHLCYQADVSGNNGTTDDDRTALLATLSVQRKEDIRKGTTLRGPQRDDLLFRLNDRDARLYASQGQQRSIALSVKLGELSLMRHQIGEPPILLLDDVLSELDEHRQSLLIEAARRQQTFLTGTTLPFPVTGDVYRISAGILTHAPS